MSEWQPIETAPKRSNAILLLMKGGFASIGHWVNASERAKAYWRSERGYLFGVMWDRFHQPTHWMPVQEPPK